MKHLLNEEIKSEFLKLQELKIGTVEYDKTISGLTKLMATQIELEKFEDDQQNRAFVQQCQKELEDVKIQLDIKERENRIYLQEKQLEMQQEQNELQEEQNKHSKLNNTLQILATVGLGIAGLAVTIWGTKTTLQYEDSGVIPTTLAGREHTKKLFNKK